MSTTTTERTGVREPAADATAEVDRDGLEVYCPEAQAWARTRELFCENCGDSGHELR